MSDDDSDVDGFCRGFAERYGEDWDALAPATREAWRKQVRELLVYIDSTAFRGFLMASL